MNFSLDFAQPWTLLLLPLAALPLLQRHRDALQFSALDWLPADRPGRLIGLMWRCCAVLAILATVLALAGPGQPETHIMRSGRGAEILLLMDRSRSMDLRMLPPDWRTLDPVIMTQQAWSRGPQKSQVARELLAKFVAQRIDDRFALMFFSAAPLLVVPFTQHDEIVQAGITAGGVGRGLSETDVGAALLAAIGAFDQRAYSGSRIILLVSDGGAQLDAETRQRIQAGLLRNRIGLYWLYLRSINSPNLEAADASEAIPEIALHRFFQGLRTPYRAYQAEEPEDMAKAVAEVGRQQNFPLDYAERIPRLDFSLYCLAVAAFACLMLLLYQTKQLRSWA